MSDDNKVKLLRIQNSLLTALQKEKENLTPGSLAYEQVRAKIEDTLEKYKKIVLEIDRGIYHELQDKITKIYNNDLTFEKEINILEDIETFYEQYISIQNNFKSTYSSYTNQELVLSPVDDLNIKYYLKRKNTIIKYLDSNNKIKEYKKYIEEYNDNLYAKEQIKIKSEKNIISLDEELKRKLLTSEGKIISSNDKLKNIDIQSELNNNDIILLDSGISEDQYIELDKNAKEAKEKLAVATISYEALPSVDKKSIVDEIRIEAFIASYKLCLAKIVNLIYTPSKNNEDAIAKRENILDLLEYRRKYLSNLNIKLAQDPFTKLNINEQLDKIKTYSKITKEIDSLRKKISDYTIEIDKLETINKEYLLELNLRNMPKEESIQEELDNNYINENNDYTYNNPSTNIRSFVLPNQVTDIKSSKINYSRSKEKSLQVAKTVLSLLQGNKDSKKTTQSINPELVIQKTSTRRKDTVPIIEDSLNKEPSVELFPGKKLSASNRITNESLFTSEDPFTDDNDITEKNTSNELFQEEDPFTNDNNVGESLFTSEDPFTDDNDITEMNTSNELFQEEDPFTNDNNVGESLFTSEDPFTDDNNITEKNTSNELFKEEDPFTNDNNVGEPLFTSEDPFTDDNNITEMSIPNEFFKEEDPFTDDNNLFEDNKPFDDISLYENKIEENYEMPDLSAFQDLDTLQAKGR